MVRRGEGRACVDWGSEADEAVSMIVSMVVSILSMVLSMIVSILSMVLSMMVSRVLSMIWGGEEQWLRLACQVGSWLYGRKRGCFKGCDGEMGHEEAVL